MEIDDQKIQGVLKMGVGGLLSQQENKRLDFKETFTEKELRKLCKHFAGFANSEGGYIVFGVRDNPRELVGIDDKAVDEFNQMDPAEFGQVLLGRFSREIVYDSKIVEVFDKKVVVFYVPPAETKPTIAVRDKEDVYNGDIYYRYNGMTMRIRHTELEGIIQERIRQEEWRKSVAKDMLLR